MYYTWDRIDNAVSIAYFSMEVGLNSDMPTYSGGLGVLAGDTLSAAADLGIPMVGITLLHRKGYFRQKLDASGNQTESPSIWNPEQFLELMPVRVTISIEGRKVQVCAWRYVIQGVSHEAVSVYFLDTALPENSPWDQTLTDHLYGGDEHYRFCQEIVLGLGGTAMLRMLGYKKLQVYHMNEGHSALLGLALLREELERSGSEEDYEKARESVRHHCVFTTHTPVPVAHEQFPIDMVQKSMGEEYAHLIKGSGCCLDNKLNMTYLALSFSRYVNGVSMRHEEISQGMFPNYPINSVTNGVHAVTWTRPSFQELYDRYIPAWRVDNLDLRYAIRIPLKEIRAAHDRNKTELIAEVKERAGVQLDPKLMTIGFARRATPYKRADLLFSDIDRLVSIANQFEGLQIIYGGKAHPKDEGGKALIRRIFEASKKTVGSVRVVYLEEYDMSIAKFLCGGVDLWLNTPQKPQEASGTSGMKCALNGVPSLSILDGWWAEGCVEGVTGWAIGESIEPERDSEKEVASLYDKLESVILPMFHGRPTEYAEVMRSTIALNASFFNAQRMMFQYRQNAYFTNNKSSEVI
jgi:starch phosphorylase